MNWCTESTCQIRGQHQHGTGDNPPYDSPEPDTTSRCGCWYCGPAWKWHVANIDASHEEILRMSKAAWRVVDAERHRRLYPPNHHQTTPGRLTLTIRGAA